MGKARIKAVIFDYGNVFCRVNDQQVINYIASSFGVPIKKLLPVFSQHIGILDRGLIEEDEFWQQLASDLKKPIPQNKKILFTKKWLDYVIFYPEMFVMVKKLKKLGYKTAVLSKCIKRLADIIRQKGGYDDFDEVFISSEIHLDKPDPQVYLLAARRLKIDPKNCLYIDNKPAYLTPAQRLGMKTILATNPKQVINDIRQLLKI
jgi:epoxide hydrolase-like predicted phosphatase